MSLGHLPSPGQRRFLHDQLLGDDRGTGGSGNQGHTIYPVLEVSSIPGPIVQHPSVIKLHPVVFPLVVADGSGGAERGPDFGENVVDNSSDLGVRDSKSEPTLSSPLAAVVGEGLSYVLHLFEG